MQTTREPYQMTEPTRRGFLRALLAATASVALRPVDLLALDTPPGGLPRGRRPQRIIIVGGGMAGLTSAFELRRAGHEVVVLEARGRAGGRVRTLRAPFADGLYAEAGAARIPEIHDLTLRYVHELGLELAPFQPEDRPSVIHVDGTSHLSNQEDLLARLGCSSAEQAMGPIGALRHFTRSAREAAVPMDGGWPGDDALSFDEVSAAELLRQLGTSPELVALFDLGFGLLGELSGLDFLVQLDSLLASKYRIVGGNDSLPRAMARELGPRVRYGTPVETIEHSPGGVRVHFSGPGGGGVVSGDRAIVAVSLPILKRVRFSPALSSDKRHAMACSRYASATRVYAQVGRRFWETEGSSGFGVTDHAIEVFDASFGQDGERGVLLGYLHGELARRIDAMGEVEGVRATIGMMKEAFPSLEKNLQGTCLFSWDRDEWTRGAVVKWRPGDLRNMYPHLLAAPEGRIHFAGEHCSPWHAWIQGAAHSGMRSALEVNAG